MKSISVRDITIGEGTPKVCIPLVIKNMTELKSMEPLIKEASFDLLELRVDFIENLLEGLTLETLLEELRQYTVKPILLTYRSLREGGQIQLSDEEYLELVSRVCLTKCIDMVDIEMMSGNALVYKLVTHAHNAQIPVVMSYHNFERTLKREDIIEKFEYMEAMDADVMKIALMPHSPQDVLELMKTTCDMSMRSDKPIVTMSMGTLGKISRISGQVTGSAITFASLDQASAPGQIELNSMNTILDVLNHD